jgi:hypothetical protein
MRIYFLTAAVIGLVFASLWVPAIAPAAAPVASPMLTLTANGEVLAWPINNAEVLGVMPFRSSVPTVGRTEDGQWWMIPYPGGPNDTAWLASAVVLPNAAAATVPVYVVVQPTPQPTPVSPTPTPAPVCSYDAAFVSDVTIPDGTVVGPAQIINKVWRLRNSGTCAWDGGTVLTFVGGFQMSAPLAVAVQAIPAETTTDVSVTLYSPVSPGSYRGVWQLKNGYGQFFGPQVTVSIQVPSALPPTPVPPPPTPGASINFWADTDRVNYNQCTTIHWDVSNVMAVYLDYGGRSRGVVGQGSQSVCPSSDGKTYTLRVQRRDGTWDTRTVTININNPPPNPQINFTSDKPTVTIGTCTTVRWSVRNASRIQFNDGRGYRDVEQDGSRQVCPAYPTTYQLQVTDSQNGVHDRSVRINTAMPPPGILPR